MSSILDVRTLYQNLLNLSLKEDLEVSGSSTALSRCHSDSSAEATPHSSGNPSPVWPLRSHWSPNGEPLRPPLRPDRSVSLIEGKAPLPPPPGFPPLKPLLPALSSRYKTELCRTFSETGKCKYGTKCQFAHGATELRSVSRHPKYKTELCQKFYLHGECPYGSRCHFIHYPEEAQLHASPQLLRQSLSFSGLPTTCRSPGLPDPASFARAPSASPPPASADLPSPALEPLALGAVPAGGCCSCRRGKPSGAAGSLQSPRDYFSPAPGTPCTPVASGLPRAASSNSLSDPECYSSSSSLSGSDSPVFDLQPPGSGLAGNPHRLPIFNRLSVSE